MSAARPTLPLLLLALAACADGGVAAPSDLVCADKADCRTGLTCSFNHCILPTPNRIVLGARIIPPPTSGLLPQQLPTLPLEDGPDHLVRLLAPTVLRGTVRPADNPLIANLEGELELRTPGEIPGLDYVFSARSLEGLDVSGYGFTLAVLPGRSYTGSFRPTDQTLPRHVFRLEPSEIATGRFDLRLPARDEYLRIEGRVMQSDYSPIGAARVVVLSAAREVAAVATTDMVRGRFEVLVPPGLTSFRVRVDPPESGSTVFPTFTTEILTWQAEHSFDLIVPELAPGTEPVEAVIRVTEERIDEVSLAAATIPAVGRTVTIHGVLAGGTLRRTATTDDNGEARFFALPGAYECLVASPPQARAQTWHGYVNLADWSDGAGPEIVDVLLVPRVPFVGRVTDAFGDPVEAGTLTLERRTDAPTDQALVIAPAPFEAALGPDGYFSTRVDPGIYDVRVTPGPGTGAPHAFESALVVGEDGLRFDLGLPLPGLLHLTLAAPTGEWIAAAQIELWIADETGTPRLLAVGSTNAEGFIDLVVPHVSKRP